VSRNHWSIINHIFDDYQSILEQGVEEMGAREGAEARRGQDGKAES
jgi:hypothetical protein